MKYMKWEYLKSIRDVEKKKWSASMDSYQWSYEPFRGYDLFDCWFNDQYILFAIESIRFKKGMFCGKEFFLDLSLSNLSGGERSELLFQYTDQLQNWSREFWILCLNLCSRKWLFPTCNLVRILFDEDYTHSTYYLLGLINLKNCFLKAVPDS